MGERKIKCDCGKLIAVERDGKIFVWCKQCKKEIELRVIRPEVPADQYQNK